MKKKTFSQLRIKREVQLLLTALLISFYACNRTDDTLMPVSNITTTTRSYDHFTQEEWEIVRLMPNIKSVKWELTDNNTPPNLAVEVEVAQACKEFMDNGSNCFIELGTSTVFNGDDPLFIYIPCYRRELYSAETSQASIILNIPATELGEANYIAVRSIFTKEGEPYYGASYTNEIQSLWNPYAVMMGFDQRFPRPAYNDNLPMHISLAVEFEASSDNQYCEFYFGTDSPPVASASCISGSFSSTEYISFDCYRTNNIELAYRVPPGPVTVFHTIPYKTNIISLIFRVPKVLSY